jgi:hypothetical protein
MKTKILPYSELKDLSGYEDLCETSYNTLVEVVDKIIPRVEELNLQCRMNHYGGYQDLSLSDITHQNRCGTSACIVGVIATLFPINPSHFFQVLGFSYAHFQIAMIPKLYLSKKGGEISMWNFLFSEDWPNNFELGVKRIKTVLSGDYIEGWDYHWHGENPLFNF